MYKAFLIFKPHLLLNLSFGSAFRELIAMCATNHFTIETIFCTRYINEAHLEEFYSHVSKKPFFENIKNDFINSKGKFVCFILGDKLLRDEKQFYSDVRGIVDFSHDTHTLRNMFAINKTLNSIHATSSAEEFLKEAKILKKVFVLERKYNSLFDKLLPFDGVEKYFATEKYKSLLDSVEKNQNNIRFEVFYSCKNCVVFPKKISFSCNTTEREDYKILDYRITYTPSFFLKSVSNKYLIFFLKQNRKKLFLNIEDVSKLKNMLFHSDFRIIA